MCSEDCKGVFHYSLILIRDKVFSNKESLVWQNRSPWQFQVRLVDQEVQIKLLMDNMLESLHPAMQGWKVRRALAIRKMEGQNINPLKKRIIQSVSRSYLFKPQWGAGKQIRCVCRVGLHPVWLYPLSETWMYHLWIRTLAPRIILKVQPLL